MPDHAERRGEQSPRGRAEPSSATPPPFRRTLARVLGMQLFALLVLWLLQARYAH